jgi:outer membrane protein TolC
LQTRFQQALPNGMSYSISFNLQRQTSTQTGLLFNPALSSFYGVQVYQPLLNGFGIALNRRFVTVAENNREIVRESYRPTLNDTLSSAANAYWDLIALRENVRVAEETVTTAERQYAEFRQRQELNDATPLDVLGAESRLASSRVTLLTAQTREQQQEALVKTLISKVDDPSLDQIDLEPTDVLPQPADADLPPLPASIAAALANRSAMRQAALSVKNQRIAEDVTRKNLLPTLSVIAAYNGFALNGATTMAVRQLWHAAFPEYSFGLTLSVPVFNRAAQADAMRAQFERQSTETALQRTDLRTAESAEIQASTNYAKALVARDVAVNGIIDR